jgi:hypothetical protein
MLSVSRGIPKYKVIGAEEVDGNPLSAHLPLAPETDDDAFMALATRPEFDVAERNLPNSIRRLRINRLRRFYAPTMPVHRRALSSICTSIVDGYIARNPMTALGQRILQGCQVDLPFSPMITMIAGHSGMGKSTLINRVLGYLGGQLWGHTNFHGVPFPESQIVWLRRNVPEHCTVGTLCSTFGEYTDSVLGLKLYSGIFSKLQGSGRNTYLAEIRKIVTSHHVGLLILDEFQNLSLMGVGAKKIIALLVNLRDELGLPIVVVGTYKALRLLKSELSSARRLVEGGYFDLERPLSAEDEHWQSLCSAAWEFQWVRDPDDYSAGICTALYDVSQGITGIMLTTLATAQVAAIEDGSERVTEDLIRAVFAERLKPLHPAIRVLQSGDPIQMDQFDDMYKNFWPSTEREGVDGATEASTPNPEPMNDDPAAAALAAAETLKARRSKHGAPAADKAAAAKPLLTDEQIRKLVLTDSVKNLISVLDGR